MTWLREGDSKKKLSGRVVWIIGRRDSGKTTLADAIQRAVPNVVLIDDFLRCRTHIRGKDRLAYNQMIGLSWSLAYQGIDAIVCAGARSKELRDYIRSEIPSVIFVYIHGRGRYCADYEDPVNEKDVIRLDGLDVKNELLVVLRKIWKITIG